MNRRAQKTKREILDAVYALTKEKSFEQITVVDIVKCADISRGTFYLHYEDKYDLLNHIENEISNFLHRNIEQTLVPNLTIEQMISKRRNAMLNVLTYLKEHKRELYVWIEGKSNSYIQQHLRSITEQIFEFTVAQAQLKPPSTLPMGLLAQLGSNIFMTVLNYWIQEDLQTPPEDIVDLCVSLMTKGPLQTLGLQLPESFKL